MLRNTGAKKSTTIGRQTKAAGGPAVGLPAFAPSPEIEIATSPDAATLRETYKITARRGALRAQEQRADLALNALRNQPNVDVSSRGLGAGVVDGAILAKAQAQGGQQTISNALRGVVQGGVRVEPTSDAAQGGASGSAKASRPSPARDESRTGTQSAAPAPAATEQADAGLVQPTAGISVGLTFWETALLAGGVILFFILD
jgi:hypothetical protein